MVNVTKPKNDTVFRFLLHRNSVLTILISKIEYERECGYKLNRLDFNLIIFSVEIEKLTPSFHPNIIFSNKIDPVSLRIMSLHNEILIYSLSFFLFLFRDYCICPFNLKNHSWILYGTNYWLTYHCIPFMVYECQVYFKFVSSQDTFIILYFLCTKVNSKNII